MDVKVIPCVPITQENFSEYGDFMTVFTREADAVNDELSFWNKLGAMDHTGNTSVSIVQTYGKNGLIEKNLERHQYTEETLIPTDDIVVVTALSDSDNSGIPDLHTVKAFAVKKGSAVKFHRNTWHHAPLTQLPETNTFVIFKETTPSEDCFVIDLPEQFGLYYQVKI